MMAMIAFGGGLPVIPLGGWGKIQNSEFKIQNYVLDGRSYD
jgi:hypothetical protein